MGSAMRDHDEIAGLQSNIVAVLQSYMAITLLHQMEAAGMLVGRYRDRPVSIEFSTEVEGALKVQGFEHLIENVHKLMPVE
jgi:hypothetical protein